MTEQVGIQSAGVYDQYSTERFQRSASDKPPGYLGQSDFLSLMTAQLKNQDPMSPTDNGEFIAQMAQFSMVTGIDQMNESMSSLAGSMTSNRALQASIMVGKQVLAPSANLTLPPSGTVDGAVELNATASDVNVTIEKPNGEVVRTLSLGPQGAGMSGFQWDGQDNRGNRLPAGNYVIKAEARTGNAAQGVETFLRGNVNSVAMGEAGGKGLTLNVAGIGQVGMDAIKEISS